jgi:hypothetical protein
LAIAEAAKRGAKYVRFVDDFIFVCQTKDDAKFFRRFSRHHLRKILNIKMHPNKVYIQEVKKGAKMVGSVVKPGRIYLANRTVGHFIEAAKALDAACEEHDAEQVKAWVRSINSYLGFLVHNQSYAIRRKVLGQLTHLHEACYVRSKFNAVKIKRNVSWLS